MIADIHSGLNDEKRAILRKDGSILVIANPGTGKTVLLAHKFLDLVSKGVPVKDILCLTFTNKAKREMESKIITVLTEQKAKVDLSKLNVFTFHSFALDYLDEGTIISTNLLRFVIYEYLKEKEVFSYADERLVSDVVPRFENLMRYLKSYGITPDKIDKNKVKTLIMDFERSNDTIEKADLEKFLDYFIEIYKLYEKEKAKKGFDYADLLINFLKKKNKPKFKYVLVDELQDVNNLEARIALECGETFFAVGDKKQAIFGFQGGSIENFKLFKERNPSEFKLIENRRSSQQILDYAAKDYTNKSSDVSTKNELIGLKNFENRQGIKPLVIESQKDELIGKICSLLNTLKDEKVAVVVRTNTQILSLAKELENREIDFSSTHVSSSMEAKNNIIVFIKSIFSTNIDDVKNAFFTPFFPISLEKAFELTAQKNLKLENVFIECKEFREIREKQKDLETINELFNEVIFPISVANGEEYLLAAQSMKKSVQEALTMLNDKTLNNLILYLEACDLETSTAKKDAKITLTTVHKAKGLEYDTVIYCPKKTRDSTAFYDYVIERILESQDKLVAGEIEEESLRIDFVAFTRAKKKLYIITEKAMDYMNENAIIHEIEPEATSKNYKENQKRAYNLFVNKKYDEAKKLLEENNDWLIEFVKNHFDNLETISFSRLTTNAYEYFTKNILQLRESTYATNLGSNVHDLLESYLNGENVNPGKEEKTYFENGVKLITTIKKEYPEFVEAEHEINIELNKIVPTTDLIHFKGFIDAIFKKGDNYLIVDWKTSKNDDKASEYRRQLELYKRTYAEQIGINPEKIRVLIAFIGLRKVINDGTINSEIDSAQPRSNVYETVKKHLQKFLEWKQNPETFFKELKETKNNDLLLKSLLEQYSKECE